MSILNIAAYRFVALDQLPALRQQLRDAASAQALKGTVLLAHEGINLFLAGSEAGIQAFVATLDADPRFAQLTLRRSWSETVPFRRLLVKVKPEIITLRAPGLRPAEAPAPRVAPARLKAWLDQGHDDAGRPVVMVDTRNRFEIEKGRFAGAREAAISRFSDYPAQVSALGDLDGKTVVTYCTGGIRCEKAAPWMLSAGYSHVYQLDGGILGYFEACGGAHYQGSCVVFDERGALDSSLKPKI
jgi:UPF0176 protein